MMMGLNYNVMNSLKRKQQEPLTGQQVLKKIERSAVDSAEQYELIIKNLQDQNAKLIDDREQLSNRVEFLRHKSEVNQREQKSRKHRDPSLDHARAKEKLERKQKELENWQKKCFNSLNWNAMDIQLRDCINKFLVLGRQVQEQRGLLQDEKKSFKRLQKSIKGQLKLMDKNVSQQYSYEEENKELKRRIWNLRIEEDLTGHIEVRIQDNIIGLKEKGKFIERLNTLTVEEVKRMKLKSKLEILADHDHKANTASNLKKKSSSIPKKDRSDSLTRYHTDSDDKTLELQNKCTQAKTDKGQFQIQLARLEAEVTSKQQIRKELELQLTKQLKQKEEKQMIRPKELIDVCLQVSHFEDNDPLRSDWIGQESNLVQDDRSILKNNKETDITGLVAYEDKLGLVYVKAYYSNGKQSARPIPGEYLQGKCRAKRIRLSDPKDYLKWFKVYYCNSSSRVLRMEVFSSNKIKFEVGTPKQQLLKDTTAYKMDTLTNERPTCIKSSYLKDLDNWKMTSFAIEIRSKEG